MGPTCCSVCENCGEEPKYNPMTDSGDLPEDTVDLTADPHVYWIRQYPFHRIHITNIRNKVHSINKSTFPVEDLAKKLNTPAWK